MKCFCCVGVVAALGGFFPQCEREEACQRRMVEVHISEAPGVEQNLSEVKGASNGWVELAQVRKKEGNSSSDNY